MRRLLIALMTIPALTVGAAAQQENVPSASLLRRLAESADAFRNGQQVWIVLDQTFPHDVYGVYDNRDSAQAALGMAGGTYRVYTTRTPPDTIRRQALPRAVMPGCYKNDVTTRWECPHRTTKGEPGVPIPMDDVEEIRLRITPREGEPIEYVFPPGETSAIVFTLDAFDRFIVPYYTELFGPAYAAAMRDRMVTMIERATR